MVFGLFSLSRLSVDQYPEIEIPQISVITMYPGANAADIETNITRVLEDNLNTVNNLKKLTSKSQDNVSMITVEFEYGSDLNEGPTRSATSSRACSRCCPTRWTTRRSSSSRPR